MDTEMTQPDPQIEFIRRLCVHLNEPLIAQMDLGDAMIAMTYFYAGGLFYLCESAGRLDLLDAEVFGREVTAKIKAMKELRTTGNL
jgi:hypothetical protein